MWTYDVSYASTSPTYTVCSASKGEPNDPHPLTIALVISAAAAQADTADQTRSDTKATLGGLPIFVSAIADPALPGIWSEQKNLMLATTALDDKTKSLISLAVAAQIPCSYCIYSDTLDATHATGATDKQIAEAVAVAGMTRAMSTIFNGMQVDFAQFKAEMSGN